MKRFILNLVGVFFFLLGILSAGQAVQPTIPTAHAAAVVWPTIQLAPLASGMALPVSITAAGDHSGRLFVVEQGGQIQIVRNGVKLPQPFLDVRSLITSGGERGLLGLAFSPNYAANGHFYVYYTNLSGDLTIARYSVGANPDLADPTSGVVVLTILHPTNSNHNGGQLAFGPDGYLYAGTGDGGGGGDPANNAQNLNVLLGKLLRLDVEGSGCVQNPPKAQNYCIPAGNPLVSTPGTRAEIWSYGLRNPWRFSFDRLTGDLYIADVGQDLQEEINFQPSAAVGGHNYGWKILEGNLCYAPASGCTPPAAYVPPVMVYEHGANDSNGCSVTGGYAYRGPNIYLNMQGVYFYADFCKGKIYGLKDDAGWQTQLLMTAPFTISSFGQDDSGSLYVADYSNGVIYQLQAVVDYARLPFSRYMPLMSR